MRVVIVGAGATGCSATWMLRQAYPDTELVHITVVDGAPARGAGGRLATMRFDSDAAKAEMGAQELHCSEFEPLVPWLLQ